MSTEQTTSSPKQRLEVPMDQGKSASATSSNTSLGSNKTIIVPDNDLSPKDIAEAIAMYKRRNKREHTQSGDNGSSSNKKQRPLLSPSADQLYKNARNTLGKWARFDTMVLGLEKYTAFGEHIVPPTLQVNKPLSFSFQHFSFITNGKFFHFSPLITFTYSASHSLSPQIKNAIPNGMGDERLIQLWKDTVMSCEKGLLEAQLEYARRASAQNKALYDEAMVKLKSALGDDNSTYQQCAAAAKTCAEIHRTREHNKQLKHWTQALTYHESLRIGKTRKPAGKPKRSKQNRASSSADPTPGTSRDNGPHDNNGRTTMRAQRRLPQRQGNNRGRQRNGKRNNGPDANTLAKAISVALQIDN